ncbi:MAG: hypothetical protein JNL39_12505 [Opitutaceae bacterium]|nr:hypothetical protein [Opitutaceae bacterium]
MIHFAVAFAVLLHVLFWGAGAALLAMPRPWRRMWPVLIVPGGLALQSAAVWLGAHAGLRGTNSYALASEIIPAVLLALALRRHGGRRAWTDLGRFGVVWTIMAGCLVLLVSPLAFASRGLTTISLGSCDAADYAAGARVLMEFTRTDRAGFLGLAEVVRVQSADNFFDYWIRLNHFTPSALMALNGSVLNCAPHQIVSLLTAVLLAGAVPLAFWAARAVVGHDDVGSLVVSVLFALSPIPWYAVAHVAPGQLLAAHAVVLLTWAGVALWRGRLTARRAVQFAPVLGGGYWLILGSYNFFVLICLVPAVAYAGGLALWRREWQRFAGWTAAMVVPLAAAGGFAYARVAGLAERLALLKEYDFGWRVPALTAEGWLGLVRGGDLAAWDFLGLRWALTTVAVGLIAWAVVRLWASRPRRLWSMAALTVPVLAAYLWLQVRGAERGTNASYDAYKLFAVFFPLLLPALCRWIALRRSGGLLEWPLVVGAVAFVGLGNVIACGMFIWKLAQPPLLVDGELRQLRKIEAMPEVKSVNLIFAEADMWSRLWANAFLLRKEQFFLTHTYEGRRNTPLRGEWDLEAGVIALQAAGEARRQITPRFALLDTRAPAFVRVMPDAGWHAPEQDRGEHWQWTAGVGTLLVDNPQPHALTLACTLDGWSPVERGVTLQHDGAEARPFVAIGKQRAKIALPPVTVPPGRSTLVLRSEAPPATIPGDPRKLGVAVFRLSVVASAQK